MTTTTTAAVEPPPSKPEPSSASSSSSSSGAGSGSGGQRVGWVRRARRLGSLLKETYVQWDEDQAARQAASLALYTLLSVAPLLIVSIKVAGLALGDEAARGQVSHEIGKLVGPQAGAAIEAHGGQRQGTG